MSFNPLPAATCYLCVECSRCYYPHSRSAQPELCGKVAINKWLMCSLKCVSFSKNHQNQHVTGNEPSLDDIPSFEGVDIYGCAPWSFISVQELGATLGGAEFTKNRMTIMQRKS